jgi:bifunctional DNA-binding transcriptional regulator/antitoxin component of YhaV-PrlF toxin-antitoxin module
MSISTRLIQNGQLALPPEVLRALGVAQGDLVAFEIIDHQVVMRKAGQAADAELRLMQAADAGGSCGGVAESGG